MSSEERSQPVDLSTGALALVGHEASGGQGLHELAIDPTGQYLVGANERSRDITIFRLDERTGAPARLVQSSTTTAPRALHVARPIPEL